MISFKLTKEVAVYRTDSYSLTSSTEKGVMQYRLDTNNKLRFSKKISCYMSRKQFKIRPVTPTK